MDTTERYSVETVFQIWNDRSGERIELGPDRDGLDLFEIRSVTDDGKTTNCVTLTREQLELLETVIGKALRP
jgi:hypothetical protein